MAQATACGKRRAHCATPLACHARQAGRGRCCCRAWAARRARVAWEGAREPKAPAVRRGATQGAVWASGWLGHSRLSTFARQDVSAALLMATCRRSRRRQFAHPPATSRMRAHLAALGCRAGILLHLGHAQLFHVGFRPSSLPFGPCCLPGAATLGVLGQHVALSRWPFSCGYIKNNHFWSKGCRARRRMGAVCAWIRFCGDELLRELRCAAPFLSSTSQPSPSVALYIIWLSCSTRSPLQVPAPSLPNSTCRV